MEGGGGQEGLRKSVHGDATPIERQEGGCQRNGEKGQRILGSRGRDGASHRAKPVGLSHNQHCRLAILPLIASDGFHTPPYLLKLQLSLKLPLVFHLCLSHCPIKLLLHQLALNLITISEGSIFFFFSIQEPLDVTGDTVQAGTIMFVHQEDEWQQFTLL